MQEGFGYSPRRHGGRRVKSLCEKYSELCVLCVSVVNTLFHFLVAALPPWVLCVSVVNTLFHCLVAALPRLVLCVSVVNALFHFLVAALPPWTDCGIRVRCG